MHSKYTIPYWYNTHTTLHFSFVIDHSPCDSCMYVHNRYIIITTYEAFSRLDIAKAETNDDLLADMARKSTGLLWFDDLLR
jgi:hypothetical protein